MTAERRIIKYLCADVKCPELKVAIIRNISEKRKIFIMNSVCYALLIVSICTSLFGDTAKNFFIAGLNSCMTTYTL
jgi:hypothetical protein